MELFGTTEVIAASWTKLTAFRSIISFLIESPISPLPGDTSLHHIPPHKNEASTCDKRKD
eukprot:TRINITY_DN9349_c0_g1_i1.p3 TRINITY_DN9349_c0_g1~~TRINITY_DN9349_c0_g1_i1.p3  ORF type:complete len:60 (-),score=3.48 TRINITY_DN9349_c0_g1_i1:241-420(-)